MIRSFVAAVAVAIASTAAHAVTVDANYMLGKANLANSNETSEFDGLDYLVDLYNGIAVVKPATVTDAVLKLPKSLGATVPNPAAKASQIKGNDKSSMKINLGDMTYDWLMAKWSNVHVYYYIAGLTGEITLKNDVVLNTNGKGKGLSHYALFNGTKVPDTTSTLALLGLGLGALGLVARRRKSA